MCTLSCRNAACCRQLRAVPVPFFVAIPMLICQAFFADGFKMKLIIKRFAIVAGLWTLVALCGGAADYLLLCAIQWSLYNKVHSLARSNLCPLQTAVLRCTKWKSVYSVLPVRTSVPAWSTPSHVVEALHEAFLRQGK